MATVGILAAGLTGLAAYLYGPAAQSTITKGGVFRSFNATPVADPADFVVIADTIHCEDIHYYAPANTLFTACEDSNITRWKWFPPLANLDGHFGWNSTGSIHTIDPETKVSKRLKFENFEGPFVTHGIDVIPDPANSEDNGAGAGAAVYIFAVNHVPNEAVFPRDGAAPTTDPGDAPKATSKIEVFRHVLGSSSVRHVRTIAHPLIRTPNDIYAVGPDEFYVTNDHFYRGGLMRTFEEVYPGATWSDVVRATGSSSVEAEVVLRNVRGPNGLGHGRTESEVLLTSAIGGHMWLLDREAGKGALMFGPDEVDLQSSVDNPSWYADPYADGAGGDASGFVLAGLSRGVELLKTAHDPHGREGVMVWYVTASGDGKWEQRLLWEDDGIRIRNAATAVLVGIDPNKEGGKKRAWLYVTGFSSENTVAVKVDL